MSAAPPPPPPFSRRPRKREEEEEEEEAPLPTFEVVQSGEEEGVFEAFTRKISGASDLGSRGDLRLFSLDFSTIKEAGWPLRDGRAASKIAEFTYRSNKILLSAKMDCPESTLGESGYPAPFFFCWFSAPFEASSFYLRRSRQVIER